MGRNSPGEAVVGMNPPMDQSSSPGLRVTPSEAAVEIP
jgi:hypothetical protein